MKALNGKHVLYVGETNDFLSELEKELAKRGVRISRDKCEKVTQKFIEDKSVDLIVLNWLDDDSVCPNILDILKGKELMPMVPVFSLIEDTAEAIQTSLAKGSADYLTATESIPETIRKIEAIFSENDVFSSSTSIDITPEEAKITSAGVRVYVIEDDPLLRNLLSIRLEKSNFPTAFNSDGREVIPSLKQFKPDVVILDLMLPGCSGFDVMKEIRADEELKDLPIVVFSNRDGASDREMARSLGAVSFYVKAMTDLSELIESIQQLKKKK